MAVAFLLPSPFNTVAVALLVLAGVAVLLGPYFGVAESVWWGPTGPPAPADEPASPAGLPPEGVLALATLFTVALAGLYMILANYGLTFFTGKNVYLLGLDSVGDALESLALLGMAALALGYVGRGDAVRGSAVAPVDDDEWWRDDDGEER